MEQAKPTGYPSVDKPWLKYYSEEIINAPLPDCTIYEYLVENNRAYPKDIAIHYLGRRITYGELFKRIGETSLKHAIVVSAGESLLFGLKQFYYANNPKVRLPQDSVFHSRTWFLKGGKGTAVPAFPKDPDTLALISHTGGTTGEPKGVMCSDRNINALIWQVVCNFEYKRQYTCSALCSLRSCRGPRAARSTTARWRNRR